MARITLIALILGAGCRAAPPPEPLPSPAPPAAPSSAIPSTPDKKESPELAQLKRLIADLDHDDIDRREQATRRLIDLDVPPDRLRETAGTLPPEAAWRLGLILRTLEERLCVRQWAKTARASSEYGNPGWAASQATGPPNTPQPGDHDTAWTPKDQDGGEHWIELSYRQSVHPFGIRILESFNPGAVIKVEAQTPDRGWHLLWQGADPTLGQPIGKFEVPFAAPPFATRVIRITLDTARVPGWNEIDAVELIGKPADR